jgi:hypothetical protein
VSGPSGASPPPLRLGPIDRARRSRARTRKLLWTTTIVTFVAAGAYGALLPLRCAAPHRTVEVQLEDGAPPAPAAIPAVPTIVLRGGRVLLDGVDVGSTDAIADAGRLRRVDGLYEALMRRRQEQRLERGVRERAVLIHAASDMPAIVVKSVFQTAAFAGYDEVSFVLPEAGAP